MKIEVQIPVTTLHASMRSLGYRQLRSRAVDARSFVKRVESQEYPRFHVYAYPVESEGSVLYLHLDMKKPSYEGSRAHSGEYDSDLVKVEATRLRQALDVVKARGKI